MADEIPSVEILHEVSFLQRGKLAEIARIVSEYTQPVLVFPPVTVHNHNNQSMYATVESTPKGILVNSMPRTAHPEELPEGAIKIEGGEEHIFDMNK